MSQYKYSKKRKKGEHLTYIDRQKLEMLIRENEYRPKRKRRSLREMAWLLQSSPATLSREIRRGRVGLCMGRSWSSTTPILPMLLKMTTTTKHQVRVVS